MELNIGDEVRFLNDVGGGKVSGFQKGGIVLVEDEDGFEMPVMASEVVLVSPKEEKIAPAAATLPKKESKPEKPTEPTEEDIKIAELKEMFRQDKIKKDAAEARNKANAEQLAAKERVQARVQAAKETEEKETLEARIIRLEMEVRRLQTRLERLETAKAIREKAKADMTIQKETVRKQPDNTLEVDLHAHELLDTTAGMDARDIKAYQLKTVRDTLEKNAKEKGRKIIFIHGNGEGVLRKAILDMLRRDFPKYETQDASFQQYGFGATMVTVR